MLSYIIIENIYYIILYICKIMLCSDISNKILQILYLQLDVLATATQNYQTPLFSLIPLF